MGAATYLWAPCCGKKCFHCLIIVCSVDCGVRNELLVTPEIKTNTINKSNRLRKLISHEDF